jgi:hypothetical protein
MAGVMLASAVTTAASVAGVGNTGWAGTMYAAGDGVAMTAYSAALYTRPLWPCCPPPSDVWMAAVLATSSSSVMRRVSAVGWLV